LLVFAGEFGCTGTGKHKSQHGRAYATHLRRGADTNLHPHAPGLVSAFYYQ